MRILVGILKTIENEYHECRDAIECQQNSSHSVFVIENQPNKQAHQSLYRYFMQHAYDFDVFIKIDADMVLTRNDLFGRVSEKFATNPRLKDLEIAVHDFFSDQLIWGLHAFRNTVVWQESDEDLFVDSCLVEHGERMHDNSDLAPAAHHCPNPSLFQAFHYGVHRALKVIQVNRKNFRSTYSEYQWNYLEKTRSNFGRSRDPRIGFAVLGAEVAFEGKILPEHIDFGNPFLAELFDRYRNLSLTELQWTINKLTFMNFGFLPSRWRKLALIRRVRPRYVRKIKL